LKCIIIIITTTTTTTTTTKKRSDCTTQCGFYTYSFYLFNQFYYQFAHILAIYHHRILIEEDEDDEEKVELFRVVPAV